MKPCHRERPLLSAVLTPFMAIVIGGALAGSPAAFAQEVDGYPARIHEGTCDAIGPVTDELTGVGAEIGPDGTAIPAAETAGAEMAVEIAISTTELETKLSDLVDTPHAIVVSESDEAMETVLACGNAGGAMIMQMPGMAMPGDELAIWLAPAEDSPYTGLALLRSEVGGASSVTIVLAEGLASGAAPGATPASG